MQRLLTYFLTMALAIPCSAQDISISRHELAIDGCLTWLRADGTTVQVGRKCDDRNAIRTDCIEIELPGLSQRVPGIDHPVFRGRTVRLGPDCKPRINPDDLPARPREPVTPEAPTISDTTIPWNGTAGQGGTFTARLNRGALHDITDVYLMQTRHFWPGAERANRIPAQRVGSTNEYRAAIPPVGWRRADHVFYQWFVDYEAEDSNTTQTTSSSTQGPHDFVFRCTANQTADTLNELVEISTGFSDNPLFNFSHPVPSHIQPHISIRNQGMPFATPLAVAGVLDPNIVIEVPSLLLYRPGSGLGIFSGANLEGLGYGMLYSSPNRRPVLGCIPSSEWFVHEAGWHTSNGGMTLFDVEEETLGEQSGPLLPPLQAISLGAVWHPRLWDLHVWLPNSSSSSAVLSINSPQFIPGMAMDNAAFFFPQTFQ